MRQYRHQEFIRFLRQIDATTPPMLDLRLIVDRYGTHKKPAGSDVAAAASPLPTALHARVEFLAQGEGRFPDTDCTIKTLARGSFGSLADLTAAIHACLDRHNQTPGVFVLSAPPARVLAKTATCEEALGTPR